MHTVSGRLVDPLNLNPTDIALVDIAHHLSNICRFGGATSTFYSVAQHAVRVARIGEFHWGAVIGLECLHHDDAEAYMGDVIRPIKSSLIVSPGWGGAGARLFDEFEKKAMAAIYAGLDLPMSMNAERKKCIHIADNAVLAQEILCFWPNSDVRALEVAGITGDRLDKNQIWTPEVAKAAFLDEHARLVHKIEAKKKQKLRQELGEAAARAPIA